jgi:signal transduction histidine kinase
MLGKLNTDSEALNNVDTLSLFQELQVHQIELEMQNDELKLANEELELQQLKLSGIYDLAPVGYFILSHTGFIEEANSAGRSLLETEKVSLTGKLLLQFISADHRGIYFRFLKDMLDSPKKQTCQLKFGLDTHKEFYAQVEGIAIKAGFSAHPQYYIAVIDITERINYGKNLDEAKERLQLSLEAASAGTWELEMDTMKFYLDEFNYKICAVPDGGFDGRYNTFISFIHPDDRDMVDGRFRTSINFEQGIDVSCRLIDKNGKTCHASIRGHVISEPDQAKRLVGIMIDITEKKHIEEETELLKESQQKAITLATLNAEENERRRISDALHDSVSQLLYSIKMKLSGHSSPEMKEINGLIDMAVQESRNISFELAPSILVDFGLKPTIEELAKRLATPQMAIQAHVSGFNERLPILMETSIFRIIQELLNNCMKHAEASKVILEIKKNKLIEIKVKDNGKGFNVSEHENSTSGSGLRSIKNRISLYNGSLKIQSQPGKGTIISIALNYKDIQ